MVIVFALILALLVLFGMPLFAALGSIALLAFHRADIDISSVGVAMYTLAGSPILIAIPLFASLTQKRFYLPWTLWLFLGAGLLGTLLAVTHREFYSATLIPMVKPLYAVSWSIAMAAIGLNADVRQLLSNNGARALMVAFAGCGAAIATFLIGSLILA